MRFFTPAWLGVATTTCNIAGLPLAPAAARGSHSAGLRRRRGLLRPRRRRRLHAGVDPVGLLVAGVVQRRTAFVLGRDRTGDRVAGGPGTKTLLRRQRCLLPGAGQVAGGDHPAFDNAGGRRLRAASAAVVALERASRSPGRWQHGQHARHRSESSRVSAANVPQEVKGLWASPWHAWCCCCRWQPPWSKTWRSGPMLAKKRARRPCCVSCWSVSNAATSCWATAISAPTS